MQQASQHSADAHPQPGARTRVAVLTDNREGRSKARGAALQRVGAAMRPEVRWDCRCFPDGLRKDELPKDTVDGVSSVLALVPQIFLLTIDVHYLNGGKFAGLDYVYEELLRLYPEPTRWRHVAVFSAHAAKAGADSDRQEFQRILSKLSGRDERIKTDAVFHSPDSSEVERFAKWANSLPH